MLFQKLIAGSQNFVSVPKFEVYSSTVTLTICPTRYLHNQGNIFQFEVATLMRQQGNHCNVLGLLAGHFGADCKKL